MTWLELVNNLGVALIISIMVIAGALVIIRAIGEEQRKNAVMSVKLIDKMFDKLGDTIRDSLSELAVGPKSYSRQKPVTDYRSFTEKKKKNDPFADLDDLDEEP